MDEFKINCPYCAKVIGLRVAVGVLIMEPGKTKPAGIRKRIKKVK